MSSSSRKARLALFLDTVWNRGDEDAADGFLADRYVIRHDPGDPWHGQTLDASLFKARLRQSRAPFPDQRFHVLRMVEEGDTVAVAWTWQGTHSGEMAGFPASGRVVTMTGTTLYDFEGDRLTGHWQEVDRLGVFRQLAG